MDFFNTKSIEEVYEEIDKRVDNYNIDSEEIMLIDAIGRISAEEVKSREIVPSFTRSTVDGYAVSCKDTFGASSTIPSMLSIVERIDMGEAPKREIKSGEASYIPTGGMLPKGADSVVMIENAEELDDQTIMIYKAVSDGSNILRRGDDISENSILIEKGKAITAYDIGVLASQGIEKIRVFRKLKFTIISTGDEIVDIDDDIKSGQIRDINSYVIASDLINMNHEVVDRLIIKDEYEKLREAVKKGIDNSDMVLISGGSSVGTKDYTSDVINELGKDGVFVHGISIKPGKPTIIGEAKDKFVFGLPGHPASSIIIYNIVVKSSIRKVLGMEEKEKFAYCKLDSNFPSSSGKTTYQMVKVYEKKGELYAKPVFGKSGMISLISKADGYIKIDSDEEGIYEGAVRKVIYI
ncbi:MAG: molybdopterin molybdotransferase MoeA [Andreesenia angusta]|nr:molybdopterin molybdotransferase MoeA [Andreesenia angusta]